MSRILELKSKLNLIDHPEGGYFKETYRSELKLSKDQLSGYKGDRNCSTGIYFLLTANNFSAFHKIVQDEMWHYYEGAPLEVHMISPEGTYSMQKIGLNLDNGEVPQFVVPGGYWFASRVCAGGEYSFVGCTVAPGFDFEDFVLADRADLTSMFPSHSSIISELTR